MRFKVILACLGLWALLNAPGNVLAELQLIHPVDENLRRISGDNHPLMTEQELQLKAQVLDEKGQPQAGVEVAFNLISPREHPLGCVRSDEGGIASIIFKGGGKPGRYSITAHLIDDVGRVEQIVYNLPVRKPNWVLLMLFNLAGGLGLFLFGMNMMSSAMQRSAGGRMRAVLGALTRNRFIGVVVGAFVTMVIQSSSATTVMLVSFVQAGLMTFAQTIGVILGADIGTTITAQLIAFKLTDYALLMIALGFGMKVLVKRNAIRNIGDVVLGFGLLFFGMYVMSSAMYPLRSFQPFLDLLHNLENPFLGILVGAIFTALIQSSSAFTGIIIVLAQQGLLTLDAGIPLIFGANIGTSVTAMLASIGAGREARRVAIAHTAFKVLGVLVMIWWIPTFAHLVRSISPGGVATPDSQAVMAQIIPRQIANAHTVFNVGLALIFLPFTGIAARAIVRLLPDKDEPELDPRYKSRFLDKGMLATPTLALNLARVEILRMGQKVKIMADLLPELFIERKLDTLDTMHVIEDKVDDLDEQIVSYLIKIGKQDISDEQIEEVYLMMHVTKQFEHIADIIDKEMRPLGRKMIAERIVFSKTGQEEVRAYQIKACKQISRALNAFRDGSLSKAKRMTRKQEKYRALEEVYRKSHFERIHNTITESLTSSEIHLDLMDGLRKINNYSVNIARALLAQDNLNNTEPADRG
ncbi:MAG: Na/Pi cotransporter family protein [bacterium]|nr:Na/Pi cotransporter family protein [bacterium]